MSFIFIIQQEKQRKIEVGKYLIYTFYLIGARSRRKIDPCHFSLWFPKRMGVGSRMPLLLLLVCLVVVAINLFVQLGAHLFVVG